MRVRRRNSESGHMFLQRHADEGDRDRRTCFILSSGINQARRKCLLHTSRIAQIAITLVVDDRASALHVVAGFCRAPAF